MARCACENPFRVQVTLVDVADQSTARLAVLRGALLDVLANGLRPFAGSCRTLESRGPP
jgi:hypothetical protein